MALTPITRKEQFYARIAGDAGQVLTPITRTEQFLQRIIDAGGGGGGGGVSSVNGKTGAVLLSASDVGAAAVETTVTVIDTVATIQPEDKHIYNCGELTSLTIDSPPSTGAWSVVFTSGSTATTTTIPSTILGLEDFAAEANTLYEINVLDNRAVVGSWEVASA